MSNALASSPRAVSITCQRCGGALTTVAPRVRCPCCGNEQALLPAELRALERYQSEVARLRQQAAADLAVAERYNRQFGGRGARSSTPLLAILLMSAPVLLLSGGAWYLSANDLEVDRSLLDALVVLIVLVSIAAPIVYVVWFYAGRKRVEVASLGPTHAVCGVCGAPASFAVGQVLERCSYCGGALLAGSALRAEGLSAAQAAARQALLSNRRAERTAFLAMGRMSRSGMRVVSVVFICVGVALVVAVIGVTVEYVQGTNPSTDLRAVLWGWAATVAIVGGGVVYGLLLRRRQARWQRALEGVAADLGGVVFRGGEAMIRWLNAYWAAPYPLQQLIPGSFGRAVAGTHRGYAVLVFADPVPLAEDGAPHLELLLATDLSDPADDASTARARPEFRTAQARLQAQGFALEASTSGLRACASAELIRVCHRSPARTDILPSVAEELARLAIALGTRPALPLP